MNRLWLRLTLAFLAVILVTVVVVAALAGSSAGGEFRRYLMERDQEAQTEGDFSPGHGMGAGGMMRGHTMQPNEEAFLARLQNVLIAAALIAGGVGMVVGLVISRTIAAPLAALSAAAKSFAARRWEQRVPVRGADEIADVARAFNAMADDLQRAETLRRNLMADIAHELRTPLTVMQGSLRALLDGVYPLEMREIATLYDETRLLSRLVNDLRELALAEAGQLPLNLQPVEVQPALHSAVEQFALAAEAQDTQIECAADPLPPVRADPDRLAQVLHNLLANAIRHTPGGRITITGEPTTGSVRIRVDDTGEGIPSADLPHIFDRFYRAQGDRASGTGLGLAIAKAWIEAMGGAIGAESRDGQGSSFWFTLKAVS